MIINQLGGIPTEPNDQWRPLLPTMTDCEQNPHLSDQHSSITEGFSLIKIERGLIFLRTQRKFLGLDWKVSPPEIYRLRPSINGPCIFDLYAFVSIHNAFTRRIFNVVRTAKKTALQQCFNFKTEQFLRHGIHLLSNKWQEVILNYSAYINS